jgi:hypothetical protein
VHCLTSVHEGRWHRPDVAAVVYGAAHIPTVIGHLLALGYQPTACEWLTVFGFEPTHTLVTTRRSKMPCEHGLSGPLSSRRPSSTGAGQCPMTLAVTLWPRPVVTSMIVRTPPGSL